MTILRALYVLEEQTESKTAQGDDRRRCARTSRPGLLLSDALARHPKVFSPLYVAMVAPGETGGVLEEALMRVADQLEKDAALRRQVRSAMIYPTLVISFARDRAARAGRVPDPGVRGRLQAVRRQAAGAHPVHGRTSRTCVTDQWYLLIVVRVGRSSARSSRWKRRPVGPRRSGTRSSCASR